MKTATPFSDRLLFAFLAFLLVGLFAARHLSTWPARLRYPGELQHVEGIPLAEMVHLRQGVPIYAPASLEGFDAANYGPLYYLLGARLIDPQKPAYRPLRTVTLLGMLGCAVGSALLAFWLSQSFLAAALAPLLFLSYGVLTGCDISTRSDTVAVFLVFAGFLTAYRLQKSRGLLLAAPLMLVGFFYKQQFVAAPLAVVLFLLLEKRYRLAVELAGILTLGGLAALALFQFLVFPGQAFLLHFVVYNLWPLSLNQFAAGVYFFGLVLLLPFLMGVAFLRSYPQKLVSCYVGCAILLSLSGAAKRGSASHYFFECAVVLSSLPAALYAKRIQESLRSADLICVFGINLLLGLGLTPLAPRPEDLARDRNVQDYLWRNFPPHTLALGYYTGDLVRAGLATPITDLYAYGQLIRTGTLFDRDLMTQLHKRRFGIIATYFDLRNVNLKDRADFSLTEPLRLAILMNYQLATTLDLPRPERIREDDRFYAWVPRQVQAQCPPSTGRD